MLKFFLLIFMSLIFSVASAQVNGAGSTLAAPVYSNIILARSFFSNIPVTYNPVGSGKGVSELEANLTDFCGSDAVLPESAYQQYPDLQMYPTVAAAVALYHNLDASRVAGEALVFSRLVVAKIFLGEITFWDDPAILSTNTNLSLPHKKINVYVRVDSSGTSQIFTAGLSIFYTQFAKFVGVSSSPNVWCGNASNQTVTYHQAGGTRYSCTKCFKEGLGNPIHVCFLASSAMIDLVALDKFGLSYSVFNPENFNYVQMASMINKANKVVAPSVDAISYATMELGGTFTNHMTADLLDSGSSFGWPLVSYTYLVVRKNTQISTCQVRKEMVEFWVWFYQTEGVWNLITGTGFAPLPSFIAEMVVSKLVSDVQCVDSTGNNSLAAPYLLQAKSVNSLVSGPILSSFGLLNDVYSSFIDAEESWTLLPITSATALPSMSSSTNDAFFAIYSPDLSKKEDEDFIVAQKGYSTPYVLFGLVPVFSLVGVNYTLNMSADVLAKIYTCDIVAWDHELILSQNPMLKGHRAAKGKNITLVYRVDQTDSTHILTKFLALNNENFNNIIGQGPTFSTMCRNSVIVSSELLMSAEVRFNDGTLGYLSMSSAMAGALQNISLSIQKGQNTVTSSMSTMKNCLKSASWVQALPAPITYLKLPFANFCDLACWPLTIVANIFVPTQYSTVHSESFAIVVWDFLLGSTSGGF